VFTLFFLPAIYLLIARDHRAEARVAAPGPAPAESPEPVSLDGLLHSGTRP
jgi:hypothetical protein